MTNQQILSLYNGLQQCGNLTGTVFAYACAKNLKKIDAEVGIIQEEIKKLQLENCKKDEEGKPIINDNKYEMEDLEKFDEEYKKLLEIENNIELHRIKKSDLPANISAGQLTGIMDLVDEE